MYFDSTDCELYECIFGNVRESIKLRKHPVRIIIIGNYIHYTRSCLSREFNNPDARFKQNDALYNKFSAMILGGEKRYRINHFVPVGNLFTNYITGEYLA